jgi:hypothetical protein
VTSHYEKTTVKKDEYYHFDNLEASKLPGAVVVGRPEAEKLDDIKRSTNLRFNFGVD